MAPLTPEQQRVLAQFNRALNKRGAGRKIRKALYEAGLVEANLTNPNFGDADSLGALQERTSIYGRAHALNPYKSALRFIDQAMPIRGKYATAGQLAQAVQRSAFPARYDQRSAEANQLLQSSGGYPSASARPKGGVAVQPGVDNSAERRQLLLNYLLNQSSHDTTGSGLYDTVIQIGQLKDTPARRVSVPGSATGNTGPKMGGGVATFDGKPVAAWIVPILKQARAAGWSGTVTSGERTASQQMAAARRFGLQHYGPGGPLGSNHVYRNLKHGGGAVDVSNPDQLAAILQKLGVKKLRRGMANDPVHFSATGF